jgi:hypothetical protein
MTQFRNYTDLAVSTPLSLAAGSGDTVIEVVSTFGFPVPYFELAIDFGLSTQELCLCTSSGPTSFIVQRGFDSSTPQSHLISAIVQPIVSAIDLQQMNTHHVGVGVDSHLQYLNTTRHQSDLLHQVGTTIDSDLPSPSAIGDIASVGTSTAAARSDHRHQRETGPELADAISPVGIMMLWHTLVAPPGWIPCDGRTVLIDDCPQLYYLIGNAYGASSDDYTLDEHGYWVNSSVIPSAPNTNFFFNVPNITPPIPGSVFIIKADSLVTSVLLPLAIAQPLPAPPLPVPYPAEAPSPPIVYPSLPVATPSPAPIQPVPAPAPLIPSTVCKSPRRKPSPPPKSPIFHPPYCVVPASFFINQQYIGPPLPYNQRAIDKFTAALMKPFQYHNPYFIDIPLT